MEERLAALHKRAAKADDDADREALAREAGDLAERLERERVPVRPRLLAGDATPEALGGLLAQHGRLAIIEAEGGIISTLAGRRYSTDGSSNLDVLLKASAGEPVRIDRRDRCDLIERPLLALALLVQPSLLHVLLADREYIGRGLMSRCLIVAPPSRLGYRKIATGGVPADVRARYGATMHSVLAAARAPDSLALRYSSEADQRMAAYECEIEPRLHREDGDLGDGRLLPGWGGKLAGQVARFAGLLHMADCAETGIVREIPAGTVERAIRLGWWAVAHLQHALGVAGEDPRLQVARRIVAWLRRRPQVRVTTRDVYQALRLTRPEDVAPGLGVLVDRGWLRPLPTPDRGGPGRPPSPAWAVHPSLGFAAEV
ncbi:MAG: DUF3987 domain-containing protein [Planctomycetia bacterium]|nr:DUF3987 domain-containing protein [Planctomycetia bacterium]